MRNNQFFEDVQALETTEEIKAMLLQLNERVNTCDRARREYDAKRKEMTRFYESTSMLLARAVDVFFTNRKNELKALGCYLLNFIKRS